MEKFEQAHRDRIRGGVYIAATTYRRGELLTKLGKAMFREVLIIVVFLSFVSLLWFDVLTGLGILTVSALVAGGTSMCGVLMRWYGFRLIYRGELLLTQLETRINTIPWLTTDEKKELSKVLLKQWNIWNKSK